MAPRTGERKHQILQVLAEMLQEPKAERITTAALAAKLQVSEAALYRHFASKAQMFEGLIEFIEQTVFGLINKIQGDQQSSTEQLHAILTMLLGFAEKNPGMTRVLVGDALVNEHDRLQLRINQLHDRLESTIKQCLRLMASAAEQPAGEGSARAEDTAAHANVLLCFVVGRWHQFAKSGFKRRPTEYWDRQWHKLV